VYSFTSVPTADGAGYPVLTVELGGGMTSAYHERIAVAPDDVGALATVFLGNGVVSWGYYI
jgi:hypothetical protein